MRSFFDVKLSYKGNFVRDKDVNLLNPMAFKSSKLRV